MTASAAARRSATRSFRWRSWSRRWRSWTRRTRGWTSTRSRSWRAASTRSRKRTRTMSVLLITHYQRILDHIRPDVVHVMVNGRIVESGGPEVALALEAQGYEANTGRPTRPEPKHPHTATQQEKTMPQNELVHDLGLDDYKFGFVTDSTPVFRTRPGPGRRDRAPDIRRARTSPQWMLDLPLEGAQGVRIQADAGLGRGPVRAAGDAGPDLLLREAAREDGAVLGRRAGQHQGDLRAAGHSRGRAKDPGRRGRPVRLGDGLPLAQGGVGVQGRHLRLDRGRAQEPSRAVSEALRHGDPRGGQQVRGAQLGGLVRRFVRVHSAGRAAGNAAPGVLPGQPRAAGPVRAHADHRGRRVARALHRRLHGAGVLHGLVPLGRDRDHRQAGAR